MLLRNSISNTKKFFQKTIGNFKSFISRGGSTYERLPKTPPFQPFTCGGNEIDIETGHKDLDNFYTEFKYQWDSHKGKAKNKGEKRSSYRSATSQNQNANCNVSAKREATKQVGETEHYPERNGDFAEEKSAEKWETLKSKRSDSNESQVVKQMEKQKLKLSDLCSRSVREKKLTTVVQNLKELEIIGKGDVNHKMDVEEFLHYYTRLTCPAYLDIVDKFFMEICAEFKTI